jgi:L-xylulokinase
MAHQTYLLGIDNGGTATKAAVFDLDGNEIAAASERVDTIVARPGWSERDMNKMWTDTATVVRKVIALAKIKADRIVGVACTGHGNGLYLLDKQGRPLRNAINSNDERAQYYINRWRTTGVAEKALPMTAQSIWAAQPAPLLLWIRDHKPKVFNSIGTVMMAKDYVRYRLTGEINAEITDMSGTGLYNVVEECYDNRILEIYGIPEISRCLPPLLPSTALGGRITSEASHATGLAEGTPVAGGVFDVDACALSSGIINSQDISIVAGTWGNNQYIAQQPLIDPDLFMTSCYAMEGWYLMLEGSPTSAGNLEWLLDTFFASRRRRAGKHFYNQISKQVASVAPNPSQPIFLPFIYGCNSGNIKGGFFGIDASHGEAEILRAIFEGVVFAHWQHIERLLKFRDFPRTLRLTGGAARSVEWRRIFADAIGAPVEVPAGTELGALGAAMCAAVATEIYNDLPQAVAHMSSTAAHYEPDLAQNAIYKEKYNNYKVLINRLKPQ